ncbi:MAG: hypothetical protein GX556_19215 [Fibrobacter sp.]|nr:hypothetical protein [Fibrobacter sp.]
MLKRIAVSAGMAAVLFFAVGCANYAAMQSADVMPAGKRQFGGGVTFTKYQFEFFDSGTEKNIPAVIFWFRQGIIEKLEAHASFWVPLGFSAGAKYQLLGYGNESGFDMSLGFDGGYLKITSGELKTNIVDFYVPVYLGADINKFTGLYLIPKYIGRIIIGENSRSFGNTTTGTLGIKTGSRFNFLLEGTYGYDFDSEKPFINAGIGFGF